MKTDFERLIECRTDAELIQIYLEKEEYQPQYVELLLIGIENRELMPSIEFVKSLALMTDEQLEVLKEDWNNRDETIRTFIKKEIHRREKLAGKRLTVFPEDIKKKTGETVEIESRLLGYILDNFFMGIFLVVLVVLMDVEIDDWQVLSFFMYFIYYSLFEVIIQKTPAKIILGMEVVDENGNKPKPSRMIGRTLCRFIPFDALSFVFGGNWHDKFSETRVVWSRRKREEENNNS